MLKITVSNKTLFSKASLAMLAMLVLPGVCAAQNVENNSPASNPSFENLSGNIGLVSDYRFRGISQTYKKPALQAGIDYNHASGFYLGNWNSIVSKNSYNNGAGLEVDLYGGIKFPINEKLQGDVGLIYYYYPDAKLNSSPNVSTDNKYNNTEVYFGLNSSAVGDGVLSAKLFLAQSDYFGLNSETAGYAYGRTLNARGGSDGSAYLDLSYTWNLANQWSTSLHVGRLRVRNYPELSYTDYKLSVNKEIAGLNISLAVIGTNANKDYYLVGDSAGLNPKKLGTTSALLSITKVF